MIEPRLCRRYLYLLAERVVKSLTLFNTDHDCEENPEFRYDICTWDGIKEDAEKTEWIIRVCEDDAVYEFGFVINMNTIASFLAPTAPDRKQPQVIFVSPGPTEARIAVAEAQGRYKGMLVRIQIYQKPVGEICANYNIPFGAAINPANAEFRDRLAASRSEQTSGATVAGSRE